MSRRVIFVANAAFGTMATTTRLQLGAQAARIGRCVAALNLLVHYTIVWASAARTRKIAMSSAETNRNNLHNGCEKLAASCSTTCRAMQSYPPRFAGGCSACRFRRRGL